MPDDRGDSDERGEPDDPLDGDTSGRTDKDVFDDASSTEGSPNQDYPPDAPPGDSPASDAMPDDGPRDPQASGEKTGHTPPGGGPNSQPPSQPSSQEPSRRGKGRRPGERHRQEHERPAPQPGSQAAEQTTGLRPSGVAGFVYDILTSVIAVALVGFFLFTISGVWPPLVAIESGSMLPQMERGDLVFVMEEERFSGPNPVPDTGVVPAQRAQQSNYLTFGGHGDVIVYARNGNDGDTPIIHRAMLWVEKDENWYRRANQRFVGTASSCAELSNCPAPWAGFITKGDNNHQYDQTGLNPLSGPVKPEWVVGTAELHVPGLGFIRLGSP